jgi:hypothetical protein
MPKTSYSGSCHCGRVRFTAEIDLAAGAGRCNCSVCVRTAVTSALVKPHELVVTAGEGDLSTYQWGAKISTRYFCRHCGVHCFGRGHLAEIGGDYAAVNINCLEDVELADVPVNYWDGRHNNWEGGPRSTPWRIYA